MSQVQTFGAVLLVNLVRGESTFGRILAVSANAKDVLGVEASQLLDSDIFSSDVSPFDTATLDALRTCFSSPDPAAQAPLIGTLCRVEGTVKSKTAFLIAHTTEEGFVIDVEPISGDVSTLLQVTSTLYKLSPKPTSRLTSRLGLS